MDDSKNVDEEIGWNDSNHIHGISMEEWECINKAFAKSEYSSDNTYQAIIRRCTNNPDFNLEEWERKIAEKEGYEYIPPPKSLDEQKKEDRLRYEEVKRNAKGVEKWYYKIEYGLGWLLVAFLLFAVIDTCGKDIS